MLVCWRVDIAKRVNKPIIAEATGLYYDIFPVHFALYKGNRDLFNFLHGFGAKLSSFSFTGSTESYNSQLHFALLSYGSTTDMADLVLTHDKDIDEHQLIDGLYELRYSEDGDKRAIFLLDYLWQKNLDCPIRYSAEFLAYAVRYNKLKIVEDLISSGIDDDNITLSCWEHSTTPLWEAVARRNYDVCERLLKAGADVNLRNHKSPPVLHLAAFVGDLEIIDLLLKYGAKIDLRLHSSYPDRYICYLFEPGTENDFGGTALTASIRGGELQAIEYLLKSKAKICQDDLCAAIEDGEPYMIKELIGKAPNFLR